MARFLFRALTRNWLTQLFVLAGCGFALGSSNYLAAAWAVLTLIWVTIAGVHQVAADLAAGRTVVAFDPAGGGVCIIVEVTTNGRTPSETDEAA